VARQVQVPGGKRAAKGFIQGMVYSKQEIQVHSKSEMQKARYLPEHHHGDGAIACLPSPSQLPAYFLKLPLLQNPRQRPLLHNPRQLPLLHHPRLQSATVFQYLSTPPLFLHRYFSHGLCLHSRASSSRPSVDPVSSPFPCYRPCPPHGLVSPMELQTPPRPPQRFLPPSRPPPQAQHTPLAERQPQTRIPAPATACLEMIREVKLSE
jgi:hypothetical protein